MPSLATIYKVFIASPGDVSKERQRIEQIIQQWNDHNANARLLFLQAVRWEKHSYPELGDRAQALISQQILKDADLLIGVFWNRLGTSTGAYDSGTVEEILEHEKSGKPVMVYFSSAKADVGKVDIKQYEAVRRFESALQGRGITHRYRTLSEFENAFRGHLNLRMHQVAPASTPVPLRDPPTSSQASVSDWKAAFATTNSEREHQKAVSALSSSEAGVDKVTGAAQKVIHEAAERAKEIVAMPSLGMRIHSHKPDGLTLAGPGRLLCIISFANVYVNSIRGAALRYGVVLDRDIWESKDFETKKVVDYTPEFDRHMNVVWKKEGFPPVTSDRFLDEAFGEFSKHLK